MMDRFLSKAKRIDTGEWLIGYYYTFIDTDKIKHFITGQGYGWEDQEAYIIDQSTLSQCTGLKDKNGQLIFEGDKVKFSNMGKEYEMNVVYITPHAAFYFIRGYIQEMVLGYNTLLLEVIGNIHD